jgi:hypothetical protein
MVVVMPNINVVFGMLFLIVKLRKVLDCHAILSESGGTG